MSTSAEKQHFTVPKDYFASLQQRCMQRVLENTRDITGAAQTDGFSTPSQYFPDLKTQILSKTSQKKSRPVFRINTWAAAASIALMMGTAWWSISTVSDRTIEWSHLSEQEMNAYLEAELTHTPGLEWTVLHQESINAIDDADFYGQLPIDDYLELTVPSTKEWQHYEDQ